MKLNDAQVAAIRALEQDGQITPKAVVAAARDSENPLHVLFDWDVTAAAEKWWEHRAREVIGSVTIAQVTKTAEIVSAYYVVDTEADGAAYRSTPSLRANPESARASLAYTLEVAAGHLRRAYDLAGPLGYAAEIDALVKQTVALVRRSRPASERAA